MEPSKPKRPRYSTVAQLPRNDWRAAIELRRWLMARNRWTPEHESIVIMLQDDPTELFAAMDADDNAHNAE